jgi:transcriptional regulatory protein LevR
VRILKNFLDSCRFLDRLEASLLLKKQNELKLVESSRDLGQKRVTLRNSLTLLWPKQVYPLRIHFVNSSNRPPNSSTLGVTVCLFLLLHVSCCIMRVLADAKHGSV